MVLPAVLSLQDDALQAEIRPAQGGHAGGQCLDVGQTLGLAGGGADEQVPQPVPLRHLLRGHHAGKDHCRGLQPQIVGHLLQPGPVRTIPHQQQRHRAAAQGGPELQQLLDVLLLRKAPHAHQHSVFRRDAQAGPQNRPAHGIALLLEAPQVDARRHHEDRAANAIALQQSPHLAGGGDHAVHLGSYPAGESRHRTSAPPDAGGEVVGVVLIHRVVGVDQGDIQLLRDAAGQEKGAELTLGVDHIRPPVHQLPYPAARHGGAEAGAGIDPSGVYGADGGDAVPGPGVERLGQRQDPDLMAPALQLPLQVFHRGDHTVYRRRIPICGNQDLHNRFPSFVLFSYTTQPRRTLQLPEHFFSSSITPPDQHPTAFASNVCKMSHIRRGRVRSVTVSLFVLF